MDEALKAEPFILLDARLNQYTCRYDNRWAKVSVLHLFTGTLNPFIVSDRLPFFQR